MELRGKPRAQQMLRAHESGSASIQRLRPSYVIVEHNRLRIELHGGFDHYGYRLTRDEKNGKSVLEWYTEGGPDQSLLAWPIGKPLTEACCVSCESWLTAYALPGLLGQVRRLVGPSTSRQREQPVVEGEPDFDARWEGHHDPLELRLGPDLTRASRGQ